MNRLKFLKLSATGAAAAGVAALMINSGRFYTAVNARLNKSELIPLDPKKVFLKYGTCSQTLFNIVTHEFGYSKEDEAHATDPLAGGLMSTQNQCGMLWGSALAVGAESFRRHNDRDLAIARTISATQHLVESFSKRAKTVNCRDIVGCDFSDTLGVAKLALKSLPGGISNMICMNLAEKWAEEAIQSAKEGLSDKQNDLSLANLSCASEVAKKMGASDEEMVMVAGFAGGMGLSGNACGALGAAIWINTLNWCRSHQGKSGYSNPGSKEILKAFRDETRSELLCYKICGQRFQTIRDHTEFVKNDGCEKLINLLANV